MNSKVHPFSKEFLDGMVKNKKIEKGDGNVNFRIKDFVTFSDNSFSFIAEKSYVVTHTSSMNGRTSTTIIYHSDEIIIPRFDQNGELKNLVKIDKEYGSTSPFTVSYSLGINNDKLFLLYNDSKSREEGAAEKKGGLFSMFSAKNLFTTFSVIDYGSETDGMFCPYNSTQLGDKLLINILHGKNYHFGTLKL